MQEQLHTVKSSSTSHRACTLVLQPHRTAQTTFVLDDVYSDIVFERDLRWGIENGWLSPIKCLRVNIGYDLSGVASRMGDYAPKELGKAMDKAEHHDAIAQAYKRYAKGATLIFVASVECCEEIAKRIPGAVVVTGETKNRSEIIAAFTRREIPCIVNCMVFTEGTDIPLVETVIMARPTQSDALYTQMVGRGLRLSPGKKSCYSLIVWAYRPPVTCAVPYAARY